MVELNKNERLLDLKEAISGNEVKAGTDTRSAARHLVNMITGISTAILHNRPTYTAELIEQEIDFLLQFVSY